MFSDDPWHMDLLQESNFLELMAYILSLTVVFGFFYFSKIILYPYMFLNQGN